MASAPIRNNDVNDICSICHDPYNFKPNQKSLQLACTHIYHAECVLRWLKNHPSCPLCRVNFNDTIADQIEFYLYYSPRVEALKVGGILTLVGGTFYGLYRTMTNDDHQNVCKSYPCLMDGERVPNFENYKNIVIGFGLFAVALFTAFCALTLFGIYKRRNTTPPLPEKVKIFIPLIKKD